MGVAEPLGIASNGAAGPRHAACPGRGCHAAAGGFSRNAQKWPNNSLTIYFSTEISLIFYNGCKGKGNAPKVTPRAWCFACTMRAFLVFILCLIPSQYWFIFLGSSKVTVNKAFPLFPRGKQAHCNTLYRIKYSGFLMLEGDFPRPRCRAVPYTASPFFTRSRTGGALQSCCLAGLLAAQYWCGRELGAPYSRSPPCSLH